MQLQHNLEGVKLQPPLLLKSSNAAVGPASVKEYGFLGCRSITK